MASRVLIADDNALMRRKIRTILESQTDVQVCAEATNGLEAVQKAQQCCPDVAVMDFQMPMMDGIEATRKMKALLPSVPVLIFVLDNSRQLEWESRRAGAAAILTKAEGSTRLAQVVFALTHRHRPIL